VAFPYNPPVRIRVVAFATAADALGREATELELSGAATVAQLKSRLAELHPGLAALWPRLAVAVDGELVEGDAALTEGCEVALLPPVSGGRPASAWLSEAPLDAAAVTAAVAGPDCGAVVLFVGTVRNSHQGRTVQGLDYHAYRPMAERLLCRLADEVGTAHGARVAVAHRLGALGPGETSVVIAAAAPHREAAYRASRNCLERLKREVPIWKRERYADGSSRWREEEPLAAPPPTGEPPPAGPAAGPLL
jgi:MoaE-MoaD fusion protein